MTIPIVMGPQGAQPTPPATIRANIVAYAETASPGVTTDLPGTLVEDIVSTDVGAVALCDQALVDLVNSVTPLGANDFILNAMGVLSGVIPGQDTNTSVDVTFNAIYAGGSTPVQGLVIAQGFIVSDGTYQYAIPSGAVTDSSGNTIPVLAVAVLSGAWVVPPNTVTQLVSAPPPTGAGGTAIVLMVNNPLAGVPSPGPQSPDDYRAQVIRAYGRSSAQGFASLLRTLLLNVAGVQARLINPVQIDGGGWEIIVGGGDPYEVAYAIYTALFDISTLVGSTTRITGITNANPGVVTTNLNHGLHTGESDVHIAGVTGMTGVNGGPYTVIVLTPTTFSFGVDTTSAGSYVSGGVVTPNTRTQTIPIIDYPDTYQVLFVIPPQQLVTVTLTWNTIAPGTISATAVAQAGAPALVSYINSITVGQPINIFDMQEVFAAAIANIIPPALLTRMVFVIYINGISTSPMSGTGAVYGDPESYFYCAGTGSITISQG